MEWQGIEDKISLAGGRAKDTSLTAVLEKLLDTTIPVAEEPQLMTTPGVTLFTGDASVS